MKELVEKLEKARDEELTFDDQPVGRLVLIHAAWLDEAIAALKARAAQDEKSR